MVEMEYGNGEDNSILSLYLITFIPSHFTTQQRYKNLIHKNLVFSIIQRTTPVPVHDLPFFLRNSSCVLDNVMIILNTRVQQ